MKMKVVVLTDIHGDLEFLTMIKEDLKLADLVMLSGDITHFGKRKQITIITEAIKSFNSNIIAIPGNCDYPEVNQFLVENTLSLDCRYFVLNNHFFMGVGGSLPCPGRTPNEYSEEEFSVMLEETVAANTYAHPIVLMTHQPPFNTKTDQMSDGFHLGSHSIRHFIEKYQPLVCFCGHVHESDGIDIIGKTTIINPGPFKMGRFTSAIIQGNSVNAEIVNIFMR